MLQNRKGFNVLHYFQFQVSTFHKSDAVKSISNF